MPRARRARTNEPPRLTDDQLVYHVNRYKELKGEEAAAKKAASEFGKAIITELDARGEKTVEIGDLRISKTQASRIDYNVDKLFGLIPRKLFNKVTERQVNKTLLSAAIQSGEIPAEVVAQCAEETKNAPYPSFAKATGD